MTNTMPIFISSLFSYFANTGLDRDGRQYIETARESASAAQKELEYAGIAFAHAIPGEGEPNLKLARIAVWHYEQCIRHLAHAAETLERAQKLQLPSKYQKYVDLKIRKCIDQMSKANKQKLVLTSLLRRSS